MACQPLRVELSAIGVVAHSLGMAPPTLNKEISPVGCNRRGSTTLMPKSSVRRMSSLSVSATDELVGIIFELRHIIRYVPVVFAATIFCS